MREIDLLNKKQVKQLLGTNKGVKKLVKAYFKNDEGHPLELTTYQAMIVQAIILKHPSRILLWATTRAGKSYALSIGAILAAILRPGEKIRLIGPTAEHARIIMQYIFNRITDHQDIISTVSLGATKQRVERLRDEMSKSRVTFENKSEISIISASVSAKGRSLIGKGGSLVIVDECERIPADIVRAKIMRMVGETKNAQIFFVSNPTMPDERGYMYEVKDSPRWKKIIVDWREAVKEGRISQEFVNEQKESMTPAEFKIWYEARYPEEIEGGLFRKTWIDKAVKQAFNAKKGKKVYGLDVAEGGTDYTVLTELITWIEQNERFYEILNITSWRKADTMETARMVNAVARKGTPIAVDTIGVGKGVGDRLKELEHNVVQVKVSERPTNNEARKRFFNQKAQFYWNLRDAFEENRISITNHKQLINELTIATYDFKGSKIHVNKPSKSPDFSDSLMLAVSQLLKNNFVFDFV